LIVFVLPSCQGFFKLGVAKQIWIRRRMLLLDVSSPLSDLQLAGLTTGRKKKDQYESINPVQSDGSKQSDSPLAFGARFPSHLTSGRLFCAFTDGSSAA